MKKDVIYIDTEDDITAIIGKVKAAEAKIVALVPPKRAGVLQSAVNLKLMQKSAAEAQKRVVLITNDNSLLSLAAGVKMPVARNLQSRPEIPEIAALQVDDEEVINGEELPVGELAAAAGAALPDEPAAKVSKAEEISDAVDLGTLDGDTSPKPPEAASGLNPPAVPSSNKKDKAKKIKVPDFNSFRKKLFIGGGVLVVVIALAVWGLVYAPKATVTIQAKTSDVNISRNLTLVPSAGQSNFDALQLKPVVKQIKKTSSVDFDATGTKDIGQKATGTITVSNSSESDAITMNAGTEFTTGGGQKFVSTAAATVPGAKVSGGSIKPGTVSVSVQAATIGPEYNVSAQTYTIQGYSQLNADGQQMSGGSRETVKVVSDDDITKATEKLAAQNDEAAKAELQKQFGNTDKVIIDSFTIDKGKPTATPAVGEQATKAKVTAENTYTMYALAKGDVTQLIDQALDDALQGKPDQRVYQRGDGAIKFQQFEKFDDGTYGVRLVTTGEIGPNINTAKLAKDLQGLRYGEVQQTVEGIEGVEKVFIDFSPLWVTKVPSDTKKIDIKFSVLNDDK